MEFVYVLESAGIYKIGYTTNPKLRVLAIRSANPSTKLIAIYLASRDDETALHLMFKSKRVSNEWFLLTDTDLQYIDNYLGNRSQRKELMLLVCNMMNGNVLDKHLATAAKKQAMFKSHPLTETEKNMLKSKNVSLKMGKMIKGVWLESPHLTGLQLAKECGISLRTVRNALPIFRPPINGDF